jgi:hypothetical protein
VLDGDQLTDWVWTLQMICACCLKHIEIQAKLGDLTQEAIKVGLASNVKNNKVLRINTNKKEPFMLGDENIEDVESFVYLGSKVTKDEGTAQDVVQRIQKANGAFVNFTYYGGIIRYRLGPNSASSVAT